MKVSVIQPYYSMDSNDMEKCYKKMLELIDSCDDESDIIVLPEYCDIPANTKDCKMFHNSIKGYNNDVMAMVKKTAIRCNAIVFANFADKCDTGYRTYQTGCISAQDHNRRFCF